MMTIDSRKMQLMIARTGLKLGEFAECAGLSQPTISRILRENTCQPGTAFKIAKALDIDVSDLTYREGEGKCG